jgi:hypothetical protein
MAMAAAGRALSLIPSIDPKGLDARQQRSLRLLKNRLIEASSGEVANPWEQPGPVVYSAVRQALSEIDKLERGRLGDRQKAVLSEVVSSLHEAEDALQGGAF